MPRRREVKKRVPLPDPVFTDVQVAKLINRVMRRGKKSTAENIVYGAFDIIKKRHKMDPLDTFSKALDYVRPRIEVKSRRVGGATYQVPIEVQENRGNALAMRWLISYSKNRGEKSMREKLAAELIDASQKRGNSIKKCDDTHKMAEANKAFAHYRW
jgi:small subunit ribosomal protein S7